ncbi:MAG: mechanosensitive ion channel family protein [Chloroflexi bacterium]|nr:mechanosensitive ion channel family protein [Chloroflexota bacterium]
MTAFLSFLSDSWVLVVKPLSIFVVTFLIGFGLRKLLLSRLSRWTQKSKTQLDDIIISSLRGPSIIWLLILGIYLAIRFSDLPLNAIDISGKVLLVLGILSATLFLGNLAARTIKVYAAKVEGALPTTSITTNVARVVVFALGVLIIIKGIFNLDISPILATLGVGGLAVALALQETLSNFFAGVYISMARQIQIGDYIKLDSGEEGYVTDIHWRTIKIKALPNNIILVPNEKLARAIVTNYYLPDKELAVLVNLGVHYKSDLTSVERVTVEVAREVMKEVTGGVPGFEPFIRYNNFGDSSIGFTVIMRAREFVDQYLIKHEFIKRLHARYQAEGIVIPFPIRAINYEQEKADTTEKGSDA